VIRRTKPRFVSDEAETRQGITPSHIIHSVRLIDFQNITVMRDSKVALEDVSLTIAAGEHVAIIGPNGSGKSTLLKTITRDLYPLPRENSHARVLDKERWNVSELRHGLGIVSPDLFAFSSLDLTGRQVVLSGFFSSIGIWPHHQVTAEMEEKADAVLQRLGVAHLGDRSLTDISSGEARRLMIGRALVHNPNALIFDEPGNSLDLKALQELRDSMRRLAQSGTTIILVTHHLPEIIPEIERVVLLKGGRIFRDGAKQDVLRAETLSQLFDTRVEIVQRDGYYTMV